MRNRFRRAHRLAGLFLAGGAALGLTGPAAAQERILSYHSDIDILADGSMRVAETIRVRAAGDRIRRGIYRDFPTVYRDRLGNRFVVDFAVESVRRNGEAEPWFTEGRVNGVRVYVGAADRPIATGEHEYRIEYLTDWQLGFFESHDELYWNVNGNGWVFAIEEASARIRLPAAAGTDALAIEGWVGPAGAREAAGPAIVEDAASASIEAGRALGPGESLTFAMSWPKGLVAEPTATERFGRLLFNNRGPLIALIALALSLAYWLGVWNAHGRDPAAGPIFPHYAPPPKVSPATARYLTRMGYDQKAFSAAIINLAVKGQVTIDESEGEHTLHRIGNGNGNGNGGGDALAPGEAALLRELFVTGDRLALDNANHATLQAAMSAHGKSLRRDNYRIHFATNAIYVLPAIAIAAVSVVAILGLAAVTPLAIAVTVLTVLLIPVFAFLMRAHTPAGRRLLDRIEGFRLYLEVAEEDELDRRHPPEITPAVFETFLPYALALGVEQRWAERFNASLTPEQAARYQPGWYHGHWGGSHGGVGGIGAATAAVTGAVASSIAAAAGAASPAAAVAAAAAGAGSRR